MYNQKGFSVVALIAALVVVIAGGIVYYATKEKPASEAMTGLESARMEDTEVMEGEAMAEAGAVADDSTRMENEQDAMPAQGGSASGGMAEDDVMMEDDSFSFSGAVIAGSSAPLLDFNQPDYEKAGASDKLVVLYFYANWCPICKEEVENALYPAFSELSRSDVVGFRVNYNDNQTDDDERALAREFGVAYQHTKVFIKNGERVLKSPESWNKERYGTEIENAI
ncbi:MAG: thioredoxin family protein [Parcubacteria group bacterium]|nr:thioredoxin family protein [Parcubacteria group bacterium]